MITRTTMKILAAPALAALALGLYFRQPWLLACCVIVLLTMLTGEKTAGRVAGAWMKLAETLGKINSLALLWLIFYLLLTPLAFVYRRCSGAFRRCTEDRADTLFENVPPDAYSRESFEKPW